MNYLDYNQWIFLIAINGEALEAVVPLQHQNNTIMRTKQTIAIIGATGKMGSAIAKQLSKGNYRLLLFSKAEDKVQTVINNLLDFNPTADVELMSCAYHASWEADIIIVAVPYSAEKDIAEKIRAVANQKIVISISNPLNATFDGLATPPDTSAAEELQALLPNTKIVKAFNTISAANFETPVINGQQIDAFIAGNDKEALDIVSELVSTAGFNPIIAGNLATSRILENTDLITNFKLRITN